MLTILDSYFQILELMVLLISHTISEIMMKKYYLLLMEAESHSLI
jgi:hypothetical protein